MKIELRYFTGTGNSLKVSDTCREVFLENYHAIYQSVISPGESFGDADLIGFCFPVYAFGIPRICRKYLNRLQPFKKKQKTFVLITAGDADESGFSVQEATRILEKKNCTVVYSGVIQMPINWTTSPKPPFPPDPEEAKQIIVKGVEKAKGMAWEIMAGIRNFHRFNYPRRYRKIKFYSDYYLFKYLGLSNLWRNFRVYENCTGCGLCAKVCPTNSIRMIGKHPEWTSTCEQCMRCVNYCPREAIFQTMGGDTRGKNKYLEPEFKPLCKEATDES